GRARRGRDRGRVRARVARRARRRTCARRRAARARRGTGRDGVARRRGRRGHAGGGRRRGGARPDTRAHARAGAASHGATDRAAGERRASRHDVRARRGAAHARADERVARPGRTRRAHAGRRRVHGRARAQPGRIAGRVCVSRRPRWHGGVARWGRVRFGVVRREHRQGVGGQRRSPARRVHVGAVGPDQSPHEHHGSRVPACRDRRGRRTGCALHDDGVLPLTAVRAARPAPPLLASVALDHTKRLLANGVRVLVAEMPEARSASISVFVGAGSRMEDRTNAGTGHFLEHIVFKGTAKRPTAAELSQDIESRGGAVNAATDKEVTVFWSRLPARHWRVALDVIADLIRAPMLRPADIDSEKRVVIEELRMYRDQPQDRVHTLIDELLYPRHPLGWEIAGREPVINALDADRLRDFMARGYVPSRIVVAVAGNVDANEVFDAVAGLFADIAPRTPPTLSPAPKPGQVRVKLLGRRTEQAHVCIGWRGVPQEHPDKYSLDMLNAILGEGMSSRLFLELREKRALAYD